MNCAICGRGLEPWEAAFSVVTYCLPWWVRDDTGERMPYGFGNEPGPKPLMHTDARCGDAVALLANRAEREAERRRRSGQEAMLLE